MAFPQGCALESNTAPPNWKTCNAKIGSFKPRIPRLFTHHASWVKLREKVTTAFQNLSMIHVGIHENREQDVIYMIYPILLKPMLARS